jgi:hypothetical protein
LTNEDLQVAPHLYFVLIGIAKGWSAPREVRDAIYSTATKKIPNYFHYYSMRADDLQEKWLANRPGVPSRKLTLGDGLNPCSHDFG